AHGLSFVARWNGQTFGKFPYSVAEHSVFVEKLFFKINPQIDPKWRLAALLHDAPEYVIGDMISPVKSSVGQGYSDMDERLTAAIHQRFGLPSKIPNVIKKQIKRADTASAWLEAIQLAGFNEKEANSLFGKPILSDLKNLSLSPNEPTHVKNQFLQIFNELMELI
ncbi:HD family hydrolase, partial [Amylibacter sp.]|nr:HD family hydrolase [Amylibacter sp.]